MGGREALWENRPLLTAAASSALADGGGRAASAERVRSECTDRLSGGEEAEAERRGHARRESLEVEHGSSIR